MNDKRSRAGRGAAALAIALAAAACSTADYRKPVGDFALATSEAESALIQLNIQVTQGYQAVLEDEIVSGRAFVRIANQDCQTTSQRCRLILVRQGDKTSPYPPAPPLTRMTLVMGQVKLYAGNLRALLDADTAQQVESHVNAALGSVQNLAETVASARSGAEVPSGDVPQFATPVGAAVNWVVGQYVERVKLEGLQRATEAAKPVIRDAADLFTAVAGVASDVPRSELAEEVSLAADAFRSAKDRSSLAKFSQSAAKYDSLLTSPPARLFHRLRVAHDALAESLQGEGLTLATAIARIEVFAAEAKKLAKILREIRAVVRDEQEG